MSDDSPNTDESPLQLPPGARTAYPLLAGFVFVCMAISMFAYARFGDTITDGLDRACAEAQFEAGKKYEGLGNSAQALRYFRQAMEGRFNNPDTRILCGRSIGDLLFREGRYAEAIDAYEDLPETAYDQAGAYTGFVESLRRNGQLARAAEAGRLWLSLAEQENNGEQLLWANNALMRIAEEQGDNETALRHAKTIVAQEPGSDARLLMGRLLDRLGRRDEAIRELDAFLEHTQNTKLFSEAQALRDRLATTE